ncbi:hypothetical protein B296_00043198 [Ensete ventricosum]|uniref:Uncharacterized protein n=1 Tax=Ensete ventricosum TaxID=4639 RepID=A0A426XRS8_ENSVE|nr:hypothetical protein B296_00043198 [Ensete ventricosum]
MRTSDATSSGSSIAPTTTSFPAALKTMYPISMDIEEDISPLYGRITPSEAIKPKARVPANCNSSEIVPPLPLPLLSRTPSSLISDLRCNPHTLSKMSAWQREKMRVVKTIIEEGEEKE